MPRKRIGPPRIYHPIQVRCKQIGITQKELAAKFGLHEQTLSGWVSGETRLNYNNIKLVRMLRYLKLDINAIEGVGGITYEKSRKAS